MLTACQVLGGYEEFEGGESAQAGSGGSGGSLQAGAGGAGTGGAGAGGEAGAPGVCAGKTTPPITGGPAMVATEIGDYNTVSKTLENPACAWVDRTEVTFEQYQEFLAQVKVTEEKPTGEVLQPEEACEVGNTDLRPDAACIKGVPGGQGTHPVVCVDACDAAAFCRWAGKELCSGGPQQSVSRNPMFMACSQGNRHSYPYGNVTQNQYEAGRCNDSQKPGASCPGGSCANEVGSNQGCSSPEGVLDLVGNAAEWTGDCSSDSCDARGGSFLVDASDAECAGVKPYGRLTHRIDLGFRCCRLGN
ncbi:MAG: formylglycine-generating enzyme family protein [Polyangiaceae bacterium]|nr:formylglycine-generating enzyme family protein [Polyangiaceae bacterium]